MKEQKTHYSIFDFINGFFREAEREKFSPTEVSLFAYLIYQANRQRWWMPFECRTQVILSAIATTKRQLLNARRELKRRKIINFSEGEAKGKPAKYFFVESTLCDGTVDIISLDEHSQYDTHQDTQEYTHQDTHEYTHQDTQEYTHQDTHEYPLNKIKINNNINTERELSSLAREENFVGIDFLKKTLIDDECWQEKMRMLLFRDGKKITESETKELISQFFMYLDVNAVSIKTERDCRSHCYNWIKIKLKENGTDKRKGQDGCRYNKTGHTAPEDYQKPL